MTIIRTENTNQIFNVNNSNSANRNNPENSFKNKLQNNSVFVVAEKYESTCRDGSTISSDYNPGNGGICDGESPVSTRRVSDDESRGNEEKECSIVREGGDPFFHIGGKAYWDCNNNGIPDERE